jgi:predicted outer membrane protein
MRRTLILVVLVVVAAVVLLPLSSALARNRAHAHICALDRAWLVNDVESARYELAGANVAGERSVTPAVLQLAATVQRDDSAALAESGGVLRRLGLKVPAKMNPMQHWSLHMVSQESNGAFDRDYAWLEVANQVVEIGDANDEVRHGCDPAVRSIARNRLPYLRLHLRLASTWQTGPKG